MSFCPERTILLQIGPLTVTWYAFFIITGALLALYLSKVNLRKVRNIEVNDFTDDLFIYLMLFGIIGARLWYVIFDPNFDYLAHPAQIFRIWDGGLAIHGGFIAGLITVLVYCKIKNVSFAKVGDAIAPTVLLAQAIGRWGNFVNQECYGNIVDESFFAGPLSLIKDSMYINGAYREPMFLYESVLCLTGFLLINYLLRKYQNKRGDLIYAYLMWYGLIRFFIEGHRTDSLMLGPLKMAQLTSAAYLLIGLLGYLGIYNHFFKKKKPTVIFDLDGTLQDSEGCIIKSFKDVFKKYGREEDFTPERQVEVLGPALQDSMKKYFPDLDTEELVNYYRSRFRIYLKEELKPIDNAETVLKTLKEEGYTIGIVTTRMRESTAECLDIINLKGYIDDYICADDGVKPKPDPEPFFKLIDRNRWNKDDVIVVGDSREDVFGAANFGAYSVAFKSNPNKTEGLKEAKPNKMIDNLLEVLDIVKENHYFTYNLK